MLERVDPEGARNRVSLVGGERRGQPLFAAHEKDRVEAPLRQAGRTEPGRHGAAQGHGVGDLDPCRQLARRLPTGVAVVLRADRRAQAERIRRRTFEVEVAGDAVPVANAQHGVSGAVSGITLEPAGCDRTVDRHTVRADREGAKILAMGQPARPRRRVPGDLLVVLAPALEARSQRRQRAVERAPHVHVEGQLVELDAAAVARGRPRVGNDLRDARAWVVGEVLGADGRVDRIRDGEVEGIRAVVDTDIDVPRANRASPAHRHGLIVDLGLLVRQEAVRIDRVGVAFVEGDEVRQHEVPGLVARPDAIPVVVAEPIRTARAPLAA